MKRSEFIKSSLAGLFAMTTLNDFRLFTESLPVTGSRMPVLFIGHGSPMNGIEDNEFSRRWALMGREIPKPTAVLCISAHWFTRGTRVTAMQNPQTIHDFGGFPQALFDVRYNAPGDPDLAREIAKAVKAAKVVEDHDWGLDHGTWTIIRQMYPDAKIPVLQLSIDYTQGPAWHYALAKELAFLRKKGVLIIGSGNMIHNLGIIDWKNQDSGYDWAIEMNSKFTDLISSGNHQALINYESMGKAAKLSIPTPEHYLPLLYTLALQEKNEDPNFFNNKTMMGSISMTSVKIG